MLKTTLFLPNWVPRDQDVTDAGHKDWLHNIGLLVIVLAVLHLGALLIWLWLLTRSGSLPIAQQPLKKAFKKFSVKYDFDCEPGRVGALAASGSFGASKRNRSSQRLASCGH